MNLAFFPSFFENPAHIRFEQQEDDESIILFLRQHWITNISWILTALFMVLLPVVAGALYGYELFQLPINVPVNVLQASLVLWYMIVLAYILEKFLAWYYNIYIVTTKHIVDIDFHSLLSRQVVESQLADIQNVSTHMRGIFSSLFHFGDVKIRTSAEHQVFDFLHVSHPDIVADMIQDLRPSITREEPKS